MPRTTSSVSASKQRKARTAAKAARLDEAGLGGRRTGRASASTRRAQARRDTAPARRPVAAAAPAPVRIRGKAAAAKPTARPKSSAARKALKGARAKAARLAPKKRDAGPVMTVVVNGSRAAGAGGARFDAKVRTLIASQLSRFAARLTRVEVHFSDESGPTKAIGNDKRCRIEARPAARRPVSAHADGPTAEHALTAAAGKMKRLLTTRLATARRPRR